MGIVPFDLGLTGVGWYVQGLVVVIGAEYGGCGEVLSRKQDPRT